ncbi:hypothetical protein RI367_005243 [Sorochytrium milnesiophthora]
MAFFKQYTAALRSQQLPAAFEEPRQVPKDAEQPDTLEGDRNATTDTIAQGSDYLSQLSTRLKNVTRMSSESKTQSGRLAAALAPTATKRSSSTPVLSSVKSVPLSRRRTSTGTSTLSTHSHFSMFSITESLASTFSDECSAAQSESTIIASSEYDDSGASSPESDVSASQGEKYSLMLKTFGVKVRDSIRRVSPP